MNRYRDLPGSFDFNIPILRIKKYFLGKGERPVIHRLKFSRPETTNHFFSRDHRAGTERAWQPGYFLGRMIADF
jgi:hypothetical protein